MTKISAVIALMCALSAYVSYPSATMSGGRVPSLALSLQVVAPGGTVVLEVSLFNLRYVDRWMPRLTMLAAVASYVMAAILLALALAASSPRIVVPEAVSAGLVAGVLIELGYLIGRSWVRAERDLPPVRLSMHDDRSTST